jgi:hypothetical protein
MANDSDSTILVQDISQWLVLVHTITNSLVLQKTTSDFIGIRSVNRNYAHPLCTEFMGMS